jgi:hypothetical protein
MFEYTSVEWSGTWDEFVELVKRREVEGKEFIGSIVIDDDGEKRTRLVFKHLNHETVSAFTAG